MSKEIINKLIDKAPESAVHIIIICIFLYFMSAQADREDLLASQRIVTCHEVSERSIRAMDRNTDALISHQQVCQDLHVELRDSLGKNKGTIRGTN